MPLVFQYGSNASRARLNGADRLRGEARLVGLACTVERHHLDFTVWSEQNGCASADIVPDATGVAIWGVLYDIPLDLVYRHGARAGWRCLDEIEGEGVRYARQRIAVVDAVGHPLEAPVETYVVRERATGLLTSEAYASHIVRGLVHEGAPAGYLEYVIGRILGNNPHLDASRLRGEA